MFRRDPEIQPMSSVRSAIAFGLTTLLMASCAPGQLGTTWVEPGTPPKQYRDLLILGIAANPAIRRAYEDNFVNALRDTGISARASHTLLSDRDLSRARAVQDVVKRSGADGVIVTFLAGENPDADTSEQRTHVVPSIYGPLYPYYGRVFSDVTAPGYYANYRALRLETNLYDAGREALVWSGRSDRLDPSSDQTMISEVIAGVIEQLRADGFLPQ
jgi:hypothetical protein